MQGNESSNMEINLSKVNCPKCSAKMPALRIPKSVQQLMWGGWTCPKCNCNMDKFGKELSQ
ncbi:hypothetical protein MTsN2n4_42570 [Pseudoalteromonas sp. MTN2-4]